MQSHETVPRSSDSKQRILRTKFRSVAHDRRKSTQKVVPEKLKNSPSEQKFLRMVPKRTPVQPCTREASLPSRVQSAPVLLRWSSK